MPDNPKTHLNNAIVELVGEAEIAARIRRVAESHFPYVQRSRLPESLQANYDTISVALSRREHLSPAQLGDVARWIAALALAVPAAESP